MRKAISIVVVFLLCCTIGFSASNLQKSYLLTDDIWIRVDRLCRSAGQLGPTPVSPTSGYEILQALDALDYDSLNARQKAEWDSLRAELTGIEDSGTLVFSDEFALLDLNGALNYEVYPHNNIDSTYVDEFFVPFRDRAPLISLGLSALFGNSLSLDFEYRLQDSPMGFSLRDDGTLNSGDLFYSFHNAGVLFSPGLDGKMHYLANWDSYSKGYNFFNYQPALAGAALSNSYMSVYLGRNRQQMGNGITGNMVLGDNFTFQEMLQFSAYSRVFSYTLSLTHFDNIENRGTGNFYSTMLSGLHQNRVIHRFDINFFNRVRFAVNIGAHFLSDSAFDLRLISPMTIVHNWGNNKEPVQVTMGDEANNIMGVEIEWAAMDNLLVSSQIVVDQMAVHGENDTTVPMAIGALANAKYTIPLKEKGVIDAYAEVVYTSPYLYLNTKTLEVNGKVIDGLLDHIIGYGYSGNNTVETNYAGHTFGPDTFAIMLGVDYDSFDRLDISGSLLFKMHGENGMKRAYWPKQDSSNRTNDTSLWVTGTPEYTLRLDAGAGYSILDNLDLSVKTANIFQWNYHNVEGDFKYSFQALVGLNWTIF